MNLILLGAPGAGKGTQAARISEKYGLPHISTGDIFRKNIKEGTPVGLKAKAYTDRGELVPDEVTVEIVAGRLSEPDCKKGWLLDGFPRNTAQAEALDRITKTDAVINVDVDLDLLAARLTGRRVCGACGESHHITTMKGDKCVKCGGQLIHRADDSLETVGNRLSVYKKQTAPLIEFYAKKGLLKTVDGSKAIDDVFKEIEKLLDNKI